MRSAANDARHDLAMLRVIEEDQRLTQRTLSQRLGISLGLTNLYLKRLAHKGYIKITTVPGKRLMRYMLTPQGLSEKTKLTYEFAVFSYQFIRDARHHLRRQLQELAARGHRRVALYGADEIAELAYLAMLEANLELAAVITSNGARERFLGRAVLPLGALRETEFDALIIFSEADRAAVAGSVPAGAEIILLNPKP